MEKDLVVGDEITIEYLSLLSYMILRKYII